MKLSLSSLNAFSKREASSMSLITKKKKKLKKTPKEWSNTSFTGTEVWIKKKL